MRGQTNLKLQRLNLELNATNEQIVVLTRAICTAEEELKRLSSLPRTKENLLSYKQISNRHKTLKNELRKNVNKRNKTLMMLSRY